MLEGAQGSALNALPERIQGVGTLDGHNDRLIERKISKYRWKSSSAVRISRR